MFNFQRNSFGNLQITKLFCVVFDLYKAFHFIYFDFIFYFVNIGFCHVMI